METPPPAPSQESMAVSTSPAMGGDVPQGERNWALFAHLSSFAGCLIPFGNIIAPLVMWQMKKETMPFGSEQAKECLNFQITISIFMVISVVLMLVLVGYLMALVIGVLDIIFTVMAALKSSNGEFYRYPMCIRLVS